MQVCTKTEGTRRTEKKTKGDKAETPKGGEVWPAARVSKLKETKCNK